MGVLDRYLGPRGRHCHDWVVWNMFGRADRLLASHLGLAWAQAVYFANAESYHILSAFRHRLTPFWNGLCVSPQTTERH